MSVNDFDGTITDIGVGLDQLNLVLDNLTGLLSRHTHNSYSGLTSDKYDGRAVTKAQYDAATVAIDNLVNSWRSTYGTNIDQYLHETPV